MSDKDIGEQVLVPPGADFCSAIPPVDVVILGWMEQIEELANVTVPVILWEQGNSWLFGDFGEFLDATQKSYGNFTSVTGIPTGC